MYTVHLPCIFWLKKNRALIGFRTQKTFKKISLIKSVLLLWVKRKSQSMFIPYWGTRLLLRLKTNGLIGWMLWMRWNGMIFIMPTSSAPLKPSWGLFTLNCFIRQSALTNFSIELVELILPIVTFVIIHQKLFYTYFVNVKKFPPFGMNYVFWLIMFLGNPLLSQIMKKCLVSQTSQNMTVCLKFYLHRCKFQQANPNFVAFLKLVKIKRNTEYKIAESKGKLRQHFKKWTLDLEAH